MRIGIITTHRSHNYGAVLQAYALKTFLSKYGDCDIIDYESVMTHKLYSMYNKRDGIKNILLSLLLLPFHKYRKMRFVAFNSFIDSYLICEKGEPLSTNVELEKVINGNYDVIVFGSDQIWNPKLPNFETIFMGDINVSVKKIGYSISLGNAKEKDLIKYRSLLVDFENISMREKDSSIIIKNILGREIDVTLDPTMLLTKKEWLKLISINKNKYEKKGYIFCYIMGKSEAKNIKEAAIYLKKVTGKDLFFVIPGMSSIALSKNVHMECGPLDFLSLIYNADFVITNSFHGTCFSILFNKKFCNIMKMDTDEKTDPRIMNLLQLTGLEDRMLKDSQDIFQVINKEINYSNVEQRINAARDESIKFLNISILNDME